MIIMFFSDNHLNHPPPPVISRYCVCCSSIFTSSNQRYPLDCNGEFDVNNCMMNWQEKWERFIIITSLHEPVIKNVLDLPKMIQFQTFTYNSSS